MKTLLRYLYLAAVCSLAVGCASGKPLTQTEIEAHGTHIVKASKENTYKAIVSTLKTRGFQISLVNEEKGLIKTERRLIRSAAVSTGENSAAAVGYFRQYTFKVADLGDGRCQMTATPRIFAGDSDISEGEIWVIEGPEGERALWNSLFKEIDEVL